MQLADGRPSSDPTFGVYRPQTPYELLRRNFRSAQRAIEKDFLALNALVQEVQRLEAGGDETGEARRERLGTGEERVRGLKRKVRASASSQSSSSKHDIS